MPKYFFARNINNTDDTGIVDVETTELLCLCDEENSKIILAALNHVVSGSWLDHHFLNEDSEINGVIIKHKLSPEIYGGVAIQTYLGNFAIVKEHQKEAAKNIGASVRVKPHKYYYCTVMVLQYHDR